MADIFDEFPIVRDFTTVQDADWSKTFTYKIDGTAVNLTGYTAELVIFDDYENTKATSTTSNGGITLGGAAGTITATLDNAITNALPASNYHYTLWLINASGKRTAFSVGRFSVRKGVSA